MIVVLNFIINKELMLLLKLLIEGMLLGKMEKYSLGILVMWVEIIEKLIKLELMEWINSGLSVFVKGK